MTNTQTHTAPSLRPTDAAWVATYATENTTDPREVIVPAVLVGEPYDDNGITMQSWALPEGVPAPDDWDGDVGPFDEQADRLIPAQATSATNVTEITAQAQQAIRADIAAGRIPASVSSFPELHSYVDANEYVGILKNEDGEADYDAVNEIEWALNGWLANGGHRTEG